MPDSNPPASRHRAIDEWPTWLVLGAVYGGWGIAAGQWSALGPVFGNGLLILMTCWFMSVQHELLHGHPTRSRRINRLLGMAPLAVWYPYDLYRSTHLAHHRNEVLTEPGMDPESNYIGESDFDALPRWCKPLWIAQRTVIGRIVLGPAMVIVPVWIDILRKPRRGDYSQLSSWLQHLSLLALMLWALDRYAGIGPLRYVFTVGYPALGLAMLRSFYEHRPADEAAHRVVVNEAGWFWRLLYLNNNYHAVHHEEPGLAWHALRTRYRADRDAVLARNGAFVVAGYGSLFRHHAFAPIDSPVHPMQHRPDIS